MARNVELSSEKAGRYILFTAATLLLATTAVRAQNATYKAIPSGFDFPAPEATLLEALKSGDESKLRLHAWMIFAGLNQLARPDDAASEVIWETWYSGSEVFAAGPTPQGVRDLQRQFTVPRQFRRQESAHLQAIGESQLAFTLFNQETRNHTRENKLNLSTTFQALNKTWTAQTPVADRKIKDYPRAAMSLKIVWKLIRKTDMTPLPIWDEQNRTASAPPQPSNTWKRVVLVDPSRVNIPAGEKADATLSGKSFPGSHVVPLNAFYHFALTAGQAAQVNASGAVSDAAAGDFMVVTAMHYTTKEIPNWVWATFWWHDKADDGPYAQDRPDETILKAPWRNFLMDVAYDMDRPKEVDNSPNAVFNPWLEATFKNGVNSNCMACHQRAVWSPQDPAPAFLPVPRGSAAPDDPIFKSGTKADFLWSLLYEGNQ